MPYIKKEDRKRFSKAIESALDAFGEDWCAGDLNYLFHTIAVNLFSRRRSYQTIADIESACKGSYDEFWRLHGAVYEEEKRAENGDVEIFSQNKEQEELQKKLNKLVKNFLDKEMQEDHEKRLDQLEEVLKSVKVSGGAGGSLFDRIPLGKIAESETELGKTLASNNKSTTDSGYATINSNVSLIQLQKMPTRESAEKQREEMIKIFHKNGIKCEADTSWHNNDTELRIKAYNASKSRLLFMKGFVCVIRIEQ